MFIDLILLFIITQLGSDFRNVSSCKVGYSISSNSTIFNAESFVNSISSEKHFGMKKFMSNSEC